MLAEPPKVKTAQRAPLQARDVNLKSGRFPPKSWNGMLTPPSTDKKSKPKPKPTCQLPTPDSSPATTPSRSHSADRLPTPPATPSHRKIPKPPRPPRELTSPELLELVRCAVTSDPNAPPLADPEAKTYRADIYLLEHQRRAKEQEAALNKHSRYILRYTLGLANPRSGGKAYSALLRALDGWSEDDDWTSLCWRVYLGVSPGWWVGTEQLTPV